MFYLNFLIDNPRSGRAMHDFLQTAMANMNSTGQSLVTTPVMVKLVFYLKPSKSPKILPSHLHKTAHEFCNSLIGCKFVINSANLIYSIEAVKREARVSTEEYLICTIESV
jgi:hypothetical protein